MDEVADVLRLRYSRLPRPLGPIVYEEQSKPQEDQVEWLVRQSEEEA